MRFSGTPKVSLQFYWLPWNFICFRATIFEISAILLAFLGIYALPWDFIGFSRSLYVSLRFYRPAGRLKRRAADPNACAELQTFLHGISVLAGTPNRLNAGSNARLELQRPGRKGNKVSTQKT